MGTTVTYWPSSKIYYSGDHKNFNPIGSQSALAKVEEKNKTRILSPKLLQASKKISQMLQAESVAVANDENLDALQLVRLHPEVMAVAEEYFFLENAFVIRNIPNLEFRETFRAITNSVQRKNRSEEKSAKVTEFSELKYYITKLVGKTWTPVEDLMRTMINPQNIDLQNLAWEFKWTRNEEARKTIMETEHNFKGSSTTTTLSSFGAIGTNALHSTNKPAQELQKENIRFLKHNHVSIDTVCMSNNLFTAWTQNTWNRDSGPFGLSPSRLSKGGVVPLPGMVGINAIIDPGFPDDKIWCFNKQNAFRIGQGPQIMRKYYDEDIDGESVKISDYVQFLNSDKNLNHSKIGDRWFSFVLTVSL